MPPAAIMETLQGRWAIFYKEKVIPIRDMMINMIKGDPIDIMGCFDWELMRAWQNLFLLTELSSRSGFLPLSDEAWISTPNLWWRFLMERPVVPMNTSTQSGLTLNLYLSEELLTKLKEQDVEPVIKSRIFFSPNVSVQMKMDICQ